MQENTWAHIIYGNGEKFDGKWCREHASNMIYKEMRMKECGNMPEKVGHRGTLWCNNIITLKKGVCISCVKSC
jgi:hypothetical protein